MIKSNNFYHRTSNNYSDLQLAQFFRFEMTLKEMIEEARMMAETPDLDNIRSSPETTVQDSEFSSRKSSISQGIP